MKLYLAKTGTAHAEFTFNELQEVQSALGIAERSCGHVKPLLSPMRGRIHALLMHWANRDTDVVGPGAARPVDGNAGTTTAVEPAQSTPGPGSPSPATG